MKGNNPAAVAPAARVADRVTEQLLDTTNAVGTPAAAPALGMATLERINAGRPLPHDRLALARSLFAEEMLNDWERKFLLGLLRFQTLTRKQRRVLRAICRTVYRARMGWPRWTWR